MVGIKGSIEMAGRNNHSSQAFCLVAAMVAGLAAAAARAGDLESAKRQYTEGNMLFDQGRFAEAAASYSRALEENPKLIEAFYNRALATEMIDRAKALDEWQRFLDAAADHDQFKWDVARVRARVQILKSKPPLPEPMQPQHYVAAAGDYYHEVALSSEGEQWSELPVKVALGSAPQVKWQQGAREAFDIWSAMVPLQLLAAPQQADIRIDWSSSVTEDERAGEESDWVRVKRVGDELTGRRVATVRVDLSRNWSKDEMRAIMLHELGHALGIKAHSDSKKDIMYWQMQEKARQLHTPTGIPLPFFWRSLVKEPSQRDINTLIRLYNSAGTIARFD
jgi:predicted Zn-dependent protease